ncbi:MAG: Dabb family protein [Clostridia bacterium]|nr:Dabb family protein [Clostridia bacterium]
MIKHIVAWDFKEFAAGNDKEKNMKIAKELLEDLKGKVPSIRMIEVGFNFNHSEFAKELVLYSEFDDEEGLNAYQVHDEHQKVAAFIRSVTKDRIVADYEVK